MFEGACGFLGHRQGRGVLQDDRRVPAVRATCSGAGGRFNPVCGERSGRAEWAGCGEGLGLGQGPLARGPPAARVGRRRVGFPVDLHRQLAVRVQTGAGR